MVLNYWYARMNEDHDCYSAIAKTKREVKNIISGREDDYGPILKGQIHYKDAFDLFGKLTSEDGGRSCGVTEE